MTTAVVLAAGTGSRFGAPYPKELHTLWPGVCVIDPLMSSLAEMPAPTKTVVVVSARKPDLITHLGHRGGEIAFVCQQPRHGDGLSAALLSAAPWCEDTVLICLGDQIYLDDPVPAFTTAVRTVEAGAPVTVVAAACSDPDRLRSDGALTVTDDIVTASAEKPADPRGYNACWSALALTPVMLPTLAADLAAGHTGCLRGAPVAWGPQFGNLNHPGHAAALAATTPRRGSR